MLRRLWKAAKSFRRIREIAACQRATHQWVKLTASYLGLPVELPFEIQLASGPFRFETFADICTFWLIFFARTYAVKESDRVIIDAGANIGAFVLYALLNAPEAHVIAVEPSPDSCARLRQMISRHGLSHRCTLHEAALGSRSGVTSLDLSAGSQFRSTGSGGIEVKMLTLESITPAMVDLLKMDIEGAEYEVLSATPMKTVRTFKRIALEYHPNGRLPDCALERAGFRLVAARDDGGGYGIAEFIL